MKKLLIIALMMTAGVASADIVKLKTINEWEVNRFTSKFSEDSVAAGSGTLWYQNHRLCVNHPQRYQLRPYSDFKYRLDGGPIKKITVDSSGWACFPESPRELSKIAKIDTQSYYYEPSNVGYHLHEGTLSMKGFDKVVEFIDKQ